MQQLTILSTLLLLLHLYEYSVSASEVDALCDFYNSFLPVGWSSPCTWNGPCNQTLMDITPGTNCTDGHVISLTISSSYVNGIVPSSISSLSELITL